MLETASRFVITRMITQGILPEEDRAIYAYDLLIIFESILGHLILLSAAAIYDHFTDTLVFLISFDMLRRYAGGFHCKTNIGCISMSLLICFSNVVLRDYIERSYTYYQLLVIISMAFVFGIGAINHPNMGWTQNELISAKKKTRMSIVIFLILLVFASSVGIESKYIYFFSMGIVQCALSLGLALLLKEGGKDNEEKS